MLASIYPNMPIWGRRVLNYFKTDERILNYLKFTTKIASKEEKIIKAVEIYDVLIEKYKEKEQQEFVKLFDELLPSCSYQISDTKKIDCFTWLLG